MAMTRRELAARVAKGTGVTQQEAAKAIDAMFELISEALARGERWEFRDFGVFATKQRGARKGRNPRTGEIVPVPERRVVNFHPGKKMKERVNRA